MIASLATTALTQFLDIAGTRFAFRRFGTPAGTPLVFTQHFMGNLDNFDPAISDALAAGREIILFDNAGVGRSTGTAPHTIAGMAADAASFIDGLGLRSVDILGHSMGGEIAQLIALDRPDLVRRLVLVGTGPRGGDAIARQAPEVARLFTRRDELGEDMWLPIMFSPSKESQAAGRAFISRITARTDDRDIPVSDETIAAYRAAARGWASAPADNFSYLAGITQPALVVNGSNDIVIPTINSYHLYQHLPDAELMLLPDSGHGAHFQYAERFVGRVIDFLDVQPHHTATAGGTAFAGQSGLLSEPYRPMGSFLDHIRAGGETIPGRYRGRGPARSGSASQQDDGVGRREWLREDRGPGMPAARKVQ